MTQQRSSRGPLKGLSVRRVSIGGKGQNMSDERIEFLGQPEAGSPRPFSRVVRAGG